jgi:thioredoxin reductase
MRLGREEVEGYGGVVVRSEVLSAARVDGGFTVANGDGAVLSARRILFATGLIDELPEVPGLREHWGTAVLHCPYCHGWEVQDRAIGVLATSEKGVHQALLFRQWSEHITLFLHTAEQLAEEQLEQLAARGIEVVTGRVASVDGDGERLRAVKLEDGSSHAVDALVVAPTFTARTELLEQVGVEVLPHPMGVGSFVETDPMGATSVPGVWAAGNVTDLMGQVVTSAADGLRAAAALNNDLIMAETQAAVDAYRLERTATALR